VPESRWFQTRGASADASARIFCFPHAGGNPRTFLDWQPQLEADAEIVAVCMPGRGGEPVPSSVAELADGAAAAIRERADVPIHLFGHSLGALVAFEVARRLRDVDALRHVVASGCAAPSLLPSERVVHAARLEGRELAEAVEFFGGLPREVLDDEDLRELLLPSVQADLRLVASYRYEAAAPLEVPLTLVNGREDPHVTDAALLPWRLELRDDPARHWVDGGHFYFERDGHAVVDILRPLVLGDHGRADLADHHMELI